MSSGVIPAPEGQAGYSAALGGVAIAPRPDRLLIRVSGRAPAAMLSGMLTQRTPEPPVPLEDGIWRGAALYSAVLTPKGRMITDLRILAESGPEQSFLLELPAAGASPLHDHLTRSLPPRLARAAPWDTGGVLTLLGPGAPDWLVREALGLRADPPALELLPEGGYLRVGEGAGALVVARSAEYSVPAWDVLADRGALEVLRGRARETGVVEALPEVLLTLRLEAGRLQFGVEMDADTIPTEAGINARAIDGTKGCYTGQEVIVRIRDRGHVNRHLRRLEFEGDALPAPGTPLVRADGKTVGEVRSAALSPRQGAIGLGWVRREVEVPGELRVEAVDGAPVRILPLPE